MRQAINPVTLLAGGVGLFGIIGPNWLLLKENRLVEGEAYSAFALPLFWTITLLTIWVALALLSFIKFGGRPWVLGLLASAGLVLGVVLIGQGTGALLGTVENAERGAGFTPRRSVDHAAGLLHRYFRDLG